MKQYMLTGRQKRILDAVIREYVDTAEAVASEHLVQTFRLPFSSATVRNELQTLEEMGYLAQPHTSAGRVPTDKGYRYFINHLGAREDARERIPNREAEAMREIREIDDPMEFMKQSSRVLAHLTRQFVLAGFPEDAMFYKSGFSEVIAEPEFADANFMQEFSELLDELDDWVGRYFDPEEFAEPRTFVGDENPIKRARSYGMIISSYATPFEKESLIALVGPKRMDYERNIAILKSFRQFIDA